MRCLVNVVQIGATTAVSQTDSAHITTKVVVTLFRGGYLNIYTPAHDFWHNVDMSLRAEALLPCDHMDTAAALPLLMISQAHCSQGHLFTDARTSQILLPTNPLIVLYFSAWPLRSLARDPFSTLLTLASCKNVENRFTRFFTSAWGSTNPIQSMDANFSTNSGIQYGCKILPTQAVRSLYNRTLTLISNCDLGEGMDFDWW